MRNPIPRRTFLKGMSALGAAGIALPLLPSLARSAGSIFPKRLVVFFSPNGFPNHENYWTPASQNGLLTDLSPILSPLVDQKPYFSVLSGIDLSVMNAGDLKGESHAGGMCGVLTGRFLASGNQKNNFGYASGISLDQELANRVGDETAISSLQFGILTAQPGYAKNSVTMSHAGENSPIIPERDGGLLFDRIFGEGIQEPDVARKLRKRRLSVLDYLKEDFKVVNEKLSAEDRIRVESHLSRFRDLEKSLQNNGGQCMGLDRLDADWRSDNRDILRDTADFQVTQMVQALACDRTRIATIQFSMAGGEQIGSEFFNEDGEYYHKVSHESRYDKWVMAGQFSANIYKKILEEMRNIPEGDGTLLDNSVVLWVSEMADGSRHNFEDMPTVIAGGLGGSLRLGGRHIKFSGRSQNDLLTTILHGFGYNENFGDPAYTTGPITEILV